MTDEMGKVVEGVVVRDTVVLAPLPMGYFKLRIILPQAEAKIFLIVTPEKCWQPEAIQRGERIWGISTQLYSVRSETNWGIGDFSDLAQLARIGAEKGADVIGLNPLHALFPSNPSHFAPYAPSNRLFLNSLYIDVTSVEGYGACDEVKAIVGAQSFRQSIEQVCTTDLVDYENVSKLKRKILEHLFQYHKQKGSDVYTRYCKEPSDLARQHALFDALCEHFYLQKNQFVCWWDWPQPYRSPHTAEVKAFAAGETERVEFYLWLQGLADQQFR